MKFLAFDTSTDLMSIAVTDGQQVWERTGAGGARTSTTLIPSILELLAASDLTLAELDAIAFGRGPGSFTGLRTACAVAQGLAFGAGGGAAITVLPVNTLMALAEEARHRSASAGGEPVVQVTALLDARMEEIYAQRFVFRSASWQPLDACVMVKPAGLAAYIAGNAQGELLAGNVFAVYAASLPAQVTSQRHMQTLPTAAAMLRLAPALVAAGACVDAALALPFYVRDKVAFTTEERNLMKKDSAAIISGNSVAGDAAARPSTPCP
jgi:tRNA threonylcarbamoyladenosine biosynthesis protein TsaB